MLYALAKHHTGAMWEVYRHKDSEGKAFYSIHHQARAGYYKVSELIALKDSKLEHLALYAMRFPTHYGETVLNLNDWDIDLEERGKQGFHNHQLELVGFTSMRADYL